MNEEQLRRLIALGLVKKIRLIKRVSYVLKGAAKVQGAYVDIYVHWLYSEEGQQTSVVEGCLEREGDKKYATVGGAFTSLVRMGWKQEVVLDDEVNIILRALEEENN